MYREQYNSLFNNPQREKIQRPQTPGAGSNQQPYSQYNKSFSKNPVGYSPHKYNLQNNFPNPNRNPNISKSRLSVNSSASQLSFLNTDQGEIFPQDLVFLLKNQEKNINNFKQKIEKQKGRVENDFAVLKTEIQHILQDLKLSVQAQLDLVYKVFISKYAQVKSQVQEIRRLRKQILMANQTGSTQIVNSKDSSNNDILNQIEKDAEHFRNYRVYGYLSQMQKQKLNPILQLCSELILIGSIDSPFYRSKQMGIKHKDIKLMFSSGLSEIYQRLTDYVITPDSIIQRQKQQQENNMNILRNLQHQNLSNAYQQPPQQRQAFDVMYPDNRTSGEPVQYKKKPVSPPPAYQQQQQKHQHQPHTSQWEDVSANETGGKKCPIVKVGKSEKSMITRWAENVNLKKLERVVTDHNDSILCIFFIDNRYVATGSKDKTINVYGIDGKKVTTLRGHDAAICSLSSISNRNQQTFLASGSDHGCCCLILWDTRTWTISCRIQSHAAAVTSIVDLADGEHLVTGSYDKKINLYNHVRGEVISSYSSKSAVTSIALTSDRKKLVSAGLDQSLIVWNIVHKNNGLSLQTIRNINNNSMICILQASLLRPEIVFAATRDGKIKMFNLSSQNELQKVYTVNQNSIIQLATIERQMKAESPLVLTCSSKDKSLCLTRMDTGTSNFVQVNGACNIQFGCGIGPKIVVSPNGIMAILSQAPTAKEFSLFEVELRM